MTIRSKKSINVFCKLSKPVLVFFLLMLVVPFFYCVALPNLIDTSFVTKNRTFTVIDSVTKKAISGCNILVIWHSQYTNFPDHSSSITTSDTTIKTNSSGVATINQKLKYPAINLMPILFVEKTKVIAVVYTEGYRLKNINPDTYLNDIIEIDKITNRKQQLEEAHEVQTWLEMHNKSLSNNSKNLLIIYFNKLISKTKIDITKPYWLED